MLRKALIKDAIKIQAIINEYGMAGKMLSRSINDIYEVIRDFSVYEENGEVLGCCASQIFWDDIAEIRSLAVKKDYAKRGIGKQLVNYCIEDVKVLGVKKIFTLTCTDEFFKKLGFYMVDRDTLPQRVWKICIHCPKFPNCDEVAMMREV